MRIRMTACLVGARFVLEEGSEAEFADDEAIRLIDAGFAVPVAAPVERAVKKSTERRKK